MNSLAARGNWCEKLRGGKSVRTVASGHSCVSAIVMPAEIQSIGPAGVMWMLLAMLLAPAWSAVAACNLSVTDNTHGRGLDYNDASLDVRQDIATVENNHFSPEVEMLLRGQTTPLPGDLEFTLRYVPNHYRALAAYSKWETKNPRLATTRSRSAECYYQRAIAFRPDDSNLYGLLGTFLHSTGRLDEARTAYEKAESMGSTSAELFYNRGLLELDQGNVDAARLYSERAYSLGYPLPGLRNRLKRSEGL